MTTSEDVCRLFEEALRGMLPAEVKLSVECLDYPGSIRVRIFLDVPGREVRHFWWDLGRREIEIGDYVDYPPPVSLRELEADIELRLSGVRPAVEIFREAKLSGRGLHRLQGIATQALVRLYVDGASHG